MLWKRSPWPSLAGCIATLLPISLAGCAPERPDSYSGYAEGEYVRVASPIAGSLTELSVYRGMRVAAGAPLFALEQENERAARAEAEQELRRAEAQLEDLNKGKRPTEVAAVQAELAQAQAAARLAEAQLRRQAQLARSQFVSPDTLDALRAARDRDRARVAELIHQVDNAQLAGRVDAIRAAGAEVEAARAAVAQSAWRLGQKTQRAPVGGEVTDYLYSQGEWVPAGSPVVTLLPPENIKIRFFLPEPELGRVRTGHKIHVSCDGCPADLKATVSFISPQAEYTPPIIYSMESRAKLVYLVEARLRPEDAVQLHPGQPVDVQLP